MLRTFQTPLVQSSFFLSLPSQPEGVCDEKDFNLIPLAVETALSAAGSQCFVG